MDDLGQAIARKLKENHVRFIVTVPDSSSRPLRRIWREDPDFRLVTACHEGEAVAVGAGLSVAGEKTLVVMENAGMFQAMEAIRAMLIDMRIPLVLMVGYAGRVADGVTPDLAVERGYARFGPAATHAVQQGLLTEPVLRVLDIPYGIISSAEHAHLISWAFARAWDTNLPTALLMAG